MSKPNYSLATVLSMFQYSILAVGFILALGILTILFVVGAPFASVVFVALGAIFLLSSTHIQTIRAINYYTGIAEEKTRKSTAN